MGPLLYCSPEVFLKRWAFQSKGSHAVFLDRDGIIVEDIGYLTDPSQIKMLPGSVEGIQKLQKDFWIIVVTNQSAVARGLLDEKGLLEIHRTMVARFNRLGALIDAVYACPHHPEVGIAPYKQDCYCRKPQPGMFLQASRDFGIQLDASILVGDKDTDIVAGQRAGVSITVLIKHTQLDIETATSIKPTSVAHDLKEAAEFILGQREL